MLAGLIAALAVASAALTLFAQGCAWFWLRRRPALRPPTSTGVTILKPLKGVDDELYENLASFATQTHARLQILLGAADPEDPALAVARRLETSFPDVDIRIVAGTAPLGRNPKVANLAGLMPHVRHDLLLVSDSNVRARPDYVADLVAEYEATDASLLCSVVAAHGERTLGARLENLQLNTWLPGAMCGTQVVTGSACVVGKSMLFGRADLERLGGWLVVQDVLAEDYVFGSRLASEGGRVLTSRHTVDTVNVRWSLPRFFNRHLRWCQMRRWISPLAFVAEPLLNPTPFALALLPTRLYVLGLAVLGLKLVGDALLARRLRRSWYPPWSYVLILLKDVVFLGLWLVAAFRRRVTWRGNALWIGPGSALLDPDEGDEHAARPVPVPR